MQLIVNMDGSDVGCGESADAGIDFLDDPGFQWMCGICQDRPLFNNVQELFDHKLKTHAKVKEEASTAEERAAVSSDDEDDLPLAKIRETIEPRRRTRRKKQEPKTIEDDDDFHWDFSDKDEASAQSNKSLVHVCKICNQQFSTRSSLSKHKTTHLCPDTKEYKCATCGKLCPKYDNFIRHLEIHLENRPKSFRCDLCCAAFYNMADLKRHGFLHSDVKPYLCNHCHEGFTRQDSLFIHMAKHTGVPFVKYACKLCDKVLNSPSALAMHSKNHTKKSVFCPEPGCQFSCYLKSQLRQHIRTHSGEKPFQCSLCGRCFGRSNDMKNHILNVHQRIRPHKCPNCPKEFTLVSSLKTHLMSHLDIRPYLCAECGKRFNHPSTLRKHTLFLHRQAGGGAKKKRTTKTFADAAVQSNEPVTMEQLISTTSVPTVTVPVAIHIPHIAVNLQQAFVPTYVIPTTLIQHDGS